MTDSSSGVDSGSRLRVRGEGNSGRRGGESGDLYVYIAVKDHPELRREGTTIHSDVEISFADAILGTQVKRGASHPSPSLINDIQYQRDIYVPVATIYRSRLRQ